MVFARIESARESRAPGVSPNGRAMGCRIQVAPHRATTLLRGGRKQDARQTSIGTNHRGFHGLGGTRCVVECAGSETRFALGLGTRRLPGWRGG
jgi:hypothetical protein